MKNATSDRFGRSHAVTPEKRFPFMTSSPRSMAPSGTAESKNPRGRSVGSRRPLLPETLPLKIEKKAKLWELIGVGGYFILSIWVMWKLCFLVAF
jgi:hypothetical protein